MAQSSYSSKARSKISRHIKIHKKEGMPQRQAVAAAMSEARRAGNKVPRRKAAKKSAKRTTKKRTTKKRTTKRASTKKSKKR